MPEDRGNRPKKSHEDAEKVRQLSEDEIRELRRHIKPMKAEDRLPEGKTIITFIPNLNRRTRK
jgi:hypothetical protein